MLKIRRAQEALRDIESRLTDWRSLNEQVAALCASQTIDDKLSDTMKTIVANANVLVSDAATLRQVQTELFAASSADGLAVANRARWIVVVIIGLFAIVSAAVVYVVRQISRDLRLAVTELAEGSKQVAGAASQVASSSQSLAQGSSEEAPSLEETSSSSEEINFVARKNAENSRSAAALVAPSQGRFGDTNAKLEQMVLAMDEINGSSGKIAKIIKIIDEIAFQTNILALNAAVEAARAGQAGMGFAVVADEVRNLAQRCAQAARDTSVLIEESIAKSNDGKGKVDQVATAIRTITEEAARVKTLVEEVNLGSQEQTRGIEQVARSVVQMEQLTQSSAASAEENRRGGQRTHCTVRSDERSRSPAGGDGKRGRVEWRPSDPPERLTRCATAAPPGSSSAGRFRIKPLRCSQDRRAV